MRFIDALEASFKHACRATSEGGKRALARAASRPLLAITVSVAALVAPDLGAAPRGSGQESDVALEARLSEDQKRALSALTEVEPDLSVSWDARELVPRALAGRLTTPSTSSAERIALDFLRAYQDLFRISDVDAELSASAPERDDIDMTHLRFSQRHLGLPVFGSELRVHVDASGVVTSVEAELVPAPVVPARPLLPADGAVRAALGHLGDGSPTEAASLVVIDPGRITGGKREERLAWRVLLVGPDGEWVYFVDAAGGEVVYRYRNTHEARDRRIHSHDQSGCNLGAQLYNEAGPLVPNPPPDATKAYNFTGDTYDYFLATHGRDSYDGAGAPMSAAVQWSAANAQWSMTCLRTRFGTNWATKDVVAHEWQHGVTQFTANLVYSCESGALNESMSDVFGAMVDRDDWLMGEDLPGGYIRSLSDPRASRPPQPDTNNGANPCAEVHHNSGIPNKVAYLVSDGGVHYGVSVTGMGRGVAERIWYRALRFHMGSGTSFAGARNATINAATELYGAGSTAVCSVSSAWASVAIGSPCGPPPQDDDAVFVSQSVPTELNLNQQFQPTLTFRNVGTTTWRASDGYALGSQNGPNNTTWGHNRMPLPHDVGPQQEVTFTRVLTAPGNPATYPFKWRMVKDGVGLWFGAQSQQVNIRVGGGGLCPPAEAPQPLGPSGFIDDPTPTFSWTAVPGATKYKLYVQYGDAVGDIIINEDVFDTEYTPTNPLPVADDLRWKVKGDCPTASGPYSSIVPFHVLFADVPVGHWARSWVEALYRRPLFVSESLGTDALGRFLFGPENGIQRKHMARWLLKARHGAGYVPPPAQGIFSDVPVSSEFAPWAEAFYNQGFTAGCGASLFCPDTVVTREQAALLVLRAKEGTAYVPPACVTPTFSDVPCSSPFARWVEELHRRGITGGCAPGLFCPTAPAARAQFSVFTHKTFY